jgi:formylglycine-generating enzyme required for sulfatase activity
MPWVNVNLGAARQACSLAGKHLCKPEEWVFACGGSLATAYAYGDEYDPAICNGIDTHCYCGSVACEALTNCPYPHCYNQASSEGGGPCGAYFHLMATGSFADCRNPWGVYDLNGNVWELVDTNDGLEHFRGGAYNCGDSVALHRCDYDATWGPTARGFRCCKPPM